MKRILLAFLLMLPAMTAVNRLAYDPMPPCWPCPPPDGTKGGVTMTMASLLR